MKLAIITSRYPSQNDPYQHMFVHTRAKFFHDNGIEVQIFVPKKGKNKYVYDSITVNGIETKHIKNEINNFDLVYLHLLNMYPIISSGGFTIYRHLIKYKIPFLMYFHGNEVYKYERYKADFSYNVFEIAKWLYMDFWNLNMLRFFLNRTKKHSKLIFPSVWLLNEAKNNLKLTLNNSTVISNGIDSSFFKFEKKNNEIKYKMLTIRSFRYKLYNIKMTIDILEKLPEKYTLDIFGIGKHKEEYKSYILSKGLSNRIRIIEKFMSPIEMKELFSNYGIFVSTTDVDSQGVTIQEAMSSGLMAVVNNNTCKPEFYTNKINGIIGYTAKEIATDIENVMLEENGYNKIVSNGRNWIESELDINLVTLKELKTIIEFNKINHEN